MSKMEILRAMDYSAGSAMSEGNRQLLKRSA
jgi:hypothetical protein